MTRKTVKSYSSLLTVFIIIACVLVLGTSGNSQTVSGLEPHFDQLLVASPDPIQLQKPGAESKSTTRQWVAHRIEEGIGPVFLTRKRLQITTPPVLNGQRLQNQDLKQLAFFIRKNLLNLCDYTIGKFSPATPRDYSLLRSNNATGAVFNGYFHEFGSKGESGSVVFSRCDDTSWMLTNIWTARDKTHPLAGNRRFSLQRTSPTVVELVIEAVERATTEQDNANRQIEAANAAFWGSITASIAKSINCNGGVATLVAVNEDRRVDWNTTLADAVDEGKRLAAGKPARWWSQTVYRSQDELKAPLWIASFKRQITESKDYENIILLSYILEAYSSNARSVPSTSSLLKQLEAAKKQFDSLIPQQFRDNQTMAQTEFDRMNYMLRILGKQANADFARQIEKHAVEWADRQRHARNYYDVENKILASREFFNSFSSIEDYVTEQLVKAHELGIKNQKARKTIDGFFSTGWYGIDIKAKVAEAPREILRRNVELAKDQYIKTIAKYIRSDGSFLATKDDLRRIAHSQVEEINGNFRNIVLPALSAVDRYQTKLATYARDYATFQTTVNQLQEVVKLTQLRGGFNLQNARSVVGVVSFLAGKVDPNLARKIEVIGTTAVRIYEAVNSYIDAAKGLSNLSSALGSSLLTGNMLGAGLNVLSATGIFGGGPSTDQLILQELGNIKQQIADLAAQMNDRFDRIDRSLNEIYSRMNEGFEQVNVRLERIEGKIDGIRESLFQLQTGLTRLETNVYGWITDANRRQFREDLNGFLEYRRIHGRNLSDDAFLRYENKFYTWATNISKDSLQAPLEGRNLDPASVAEELRRFPPDANSNYLFRFAHNELAVRPLERVELAVPTPPPGAGAPSGQPQSIITGTPEQLAQLEARGVLGYGIDYEKKLLVFNKVGSWLLSKDDLKNLSGLISRLRDNTDKLAWYLRGRLTPDTRQQIARFDGSDAALDTLQSALTEDVNHLLQGSLLYDPASFGVIVTPGSDVEKLQKQNPKGATLMQLNRLLLELSFPNHVVRSQRGRHEHPYLRTLAVTYRFLEPANPAKERSKSFIITLPAGESVVRLEKLGNWVENAAEANLPTDAKILRGSDVVHSQEQPFAQIRIANPRDWSIAAEAYMNLLSDRPDLAQKIHQDRLEHIGRIGEEVQSRLNAITVREDNSGRKANRLLFDQLVSLYRTKSRSLSSQLASYEVRHQEELTSEWVRKLPPMTMGPPAPGARVRALQIQFLTQDQNKDSGDVVRVAVLENGNVMTDSAGNAVEKIVGNPGHEWDAFTLQPGVGGEDEFVIQIPPNKNISISNINTLSVRIRTTDNVNARSWNFSYAIAAILQDGSKRAVDSGDPGEFPNGGGTHTSNTLSSVPSFAALQPPRTIPNLLRVAEQLNLGQLELVCEDVTWETTGTERRGYHPDGVPTTREELNNGGHEYSRNEMLGRLKVTIVGNFKGRIGNFSAFKTTLPLGDNISYFSRLDDAGFLTALTGIQPLFISLHPIEFLNQNWDKGASLQNELARRFMETDQISLDPSLVDKINKALQLSVVQRLESENLEGTDMQRSLNEYIGAATVLEHFISMGMPRSLEADDYLRSLLYGRSKIISDISSMTQAYDSTPPEEGGPSSSDYRLSTFLPKVSDERIVQLHDQIMKILALIEEKEIVEGQRLTATTIGRVGILTRTILNPQPTSNAVEAREQRTNVFRMSKNVSLPQSFTSKQVRTPRVHLSHLSGKVPLRQTFRQVQHAASLPKLKIWANAFIPGNLPGLTIPVPGAGEHVGKTMIPGPIITPGTCFLTDQRDFDSDHKKTARMQSMVELDLNTGAIKHTPKVGVTTSVNCITGTQTGQSQMSEEEKQEKVTLKNFTKENVSTGKTRYFFTLKGSVNNKSVTPSPDIDWIMQVIVLFDSRTRKANVTVDGFIEPFPAFEMYASLGSGSAVTLFQQKPAVGSTPYELPGGPCQPITILGKEVR